MENVVPPLVLVAEEKPHLRELLRSQLESRGFQVLEAGDGLEAFSRAQEVSPDLVITSLDLPRLDGHGLIRDLRLLLPMKRTPIVVLSTRANVEDRLSVLTQGATDFITAPWNADELLVRVINLIALTRREPILSESTFYSCFISYATADESFVSRLHRDLKSAQVPCWRWDEDAKIGETLWGEIDRAIREHDKVVLVASRASLISPNVNREIERAIGIEDERAIMKSRGEWAGSVEVLFPVRLDNFIFDGWENARKLDVIRKVVGNARGWQESQSIYDVVLDRIVRDLRLPTVA